MPPLVWRLQTGIRERTVRKSVIGFSLIYLIPWIILFPLESAPGRLFAALVAVPLIWLSLRDLTDHIIPDAASLAIAGMGLTFACLTGQGVAVNALTGLAVCAIFWGAGELYFRRRGHEGFGIGDAKLIGAMICGIGVTQIWLALFLAAVGGIIVVLIGRRTGRAFAEVPFGPFLAYGFYLTLLMVVPL